ncbi:ferritin-like domain-containing protein [Hymenobacter sp. BT186]|uniref:Ferritin-like domain-containing protein n=1 Tax=Hymenobacter telluris TaxID=2816474 RepID=A0A939EUR0_9BACT|nr:ferritin-like domain-containing protein [Hymenobacter telluris]MBO0357587.1 ferritin-like domain-containing protein [Hymenobacter telluris]MBW3373613.1 ferritin-like domain-containing protein [Hymenobacter norwichensis]
MNLFNIISELEKVDPEIMDRLTHRRSALNALGDLSKKMALAAAPIAIGSAFNKAMGQQTLADPTAVLNYALLLERLEYSFYTQALAAPTLTATLTGAARTAIQTIQGHELAHVNLLTAVLGSNASPAQSPTFNFGSAFATYQSFLTFAQAFEDTGVRAYKGQAGNIPRTASATLSGTTYNLLTVALQIHSVEARHAAHVRYMRRDATAGAQTTIMPWIVNADSNGAPAAVYGAGNPAATFPAESNISQGGITSLTTMLGATYTADDVSAAFDEGLDNTTVTTIARSVVTF